MTLYAARGYNRGRVSTPLFYPGKGEFNMRAHERFLEYVKIYTTSDEQSESSPSAARELDLSRLLVRQLKDMGIEDAYLSDTGYVYAHLAATPGCEQAPALGFVAHVDTAPCFSGENVCPVIHENYNGEDIILPKENRVIRTQAFPFLKGMKGRTLITADGSTLLGADDKAGVAEIMTLCERLTQGDIPHGKICVAFTPDEEVGSGTANFDLKAFGADFAYTMDGDEVGGIEYENFNAAGAVFDITGVSVHPGSAKDVMVNAVLIACEIVSMLPAEETPEKTQGYEGFFFAEEIAGDCAHAKLSIIVRDHDGERFAERKALLCRISETMQTKYPTAKVRLSLKDSYYNMEEKIRPCMHLIENAKKACEAVGVTPVVSPIRGGTDGAHLSFMGVPCPNLGTGGHNFHGPYECISVESMDAAVEMMCELVRLYAAHREA